MKLKALTTMTAVALVAGAAVAQDMAPPATMQPIPNPPDSAAKHHMAGKHHTIAKHHKAAKPDAAPK